jgi:hypothetical protein
LRPPSHIRCTTDDPGVHKFAKLIAAKCADICASAEPEGEADLVPPRHAKLIGAELSVKILALFECS